MYLSVLAARWRPILLVLLVLPTLALASCIPTGWLGPFDSPLPPTPTLVTGTSLPFSVLDAGRGGCGESSQSAHVFLATNQAEYAAMPGETPRVFGPDSASLATDFGRHAVITVVSACGDCNEAVEVAQVLKQGTSLIVYAEERLRPPTMGCEAATSTLFQIVSIPWDGTPAIQTDVGLVLYPVYSEP